MKYKQYKFKFYLNASHSVVFNGIFGENHPNTWEITVITLKMKDNFLEFKILENKINDFLNPFQDSVLNYLKPFDTINPSMENICEYFKENIEKIMSEEGWLLLSIELSESPTRSYVINVLEDEEISEKNSMEFLADNILNKIKNMDDKND